MADDKPDTREAEAIYDEIREESEAMLRFALGRGREVPPRVVEIIEAADEAQGRPPIAELVKAHRKLAKIIAPAQPRTVKLLHDLAGRDPNRSWARLSLPRNLMIVSVVALVVLLGLGMSPDITTDPDAGNPLMSNGVVLLVNQTFFLAVAALGASFHGLFTVKRYIVEGTYDPSYAPTYWVRFLLGLISGLILASLIEADEASSLHGVARPVLALVGGFSASVVHRILERLVVTVESLIQGDSRRLLEDQQRSLKNETEQRVRDERSDTAAMLMAVQARLNEGGVEEASEVLASALEKLVPGSELLEDFDVRRNAARAAAAEAKTPQAEADEQPPDEDPETKDDDSPG